MEKLPKIPVWIEAILWTAAAVLCVSGYVYSGTVPCIACLIFIFGSVIFEMEIFYSDIDFIAIFLLAGIGMTIYGLLGILWPLLIICSLWCLIYSFLILKRNGYTSIPGVAGLIWVVLLMMYNAMLFNNTPDYLAFKNQFAVFREEIKNLHEFDEGHKQLLLDNPFKGFASDSLIAQNCRRQKDSCSYYVERYDSLCNAFKTRKQNDDFIPLIDKYEGKSEKLYIKRLWLSSDETPWTYSAYGNFKMTMNSRSGLFYHESKADLDVNYHASAVGDFSVEYVNIIFSDNQFRRYKVADEPEWLAAKEGYPIRSVYCRRGFEYREGWLDNLEKPDIDRVFDKKYYLTLK